MRGTAVRLSLSVIVLLSPLAFGQDAHISVSRSRGLPAQRAQAAPGCSSDRRTDSKTGVLISEVVLEGPVTIGSSELSTIKSQLAGVCVAEDDEVVEGLVRNVFADQGFARAEVKNVTLKTSDALAVPKPVTLKADVFEGPRYKFGEIKFVDNHVFSTSKLRKAFPVKRGESYRRSKIAGGLSEIRKLYAPRGYLDFTCVPAIQFSGGTATLTISISEGPQYHMGKLMVYANKEVADRLAGEWQLREGAVFDANYPQSFADAGHSLPREVSRSDIRLVRNCPDASVDVLVIVDQTDPKLQTAPKNVPCEKSHDGLQS